MSILPKISLQFTSSGLSKMWTRVLNLENSLFPALKEELRLEELSSKEQKLIKILDFAQIEKNITVVRITNTPKDRQECARAFIAKSVYNIQTTRDLIDRLYSDRTLCKNHSHSDTISLSKKTPYRLTKRHRITFYLDTFNKKVIGKFKLSLLAGLKLI